MQSRPPGWMNLIILSSVFGEAAVLKRLRMSDSPSAQTQRSKCKSPSFSVNAATGYSFKINPYPSPMVRESINPEVSHALPQSFPGTPGSFDSAPVQAHRSGDGITATVLLCGSNHSIPTKLPGLRDEQFQHSAKLSSQSDWHFGQIHMPQIYPRFRQDAMQESHVFIVAP